MSTPTLKGPARLPTDPSTTLAPPVTPPLPEAPTPPAGVDAGPRARLHPEALADLRASGLDDATIATAGLHTVEGQALVALLGPRLAAQVRHALVFPYEPVPGDPAAPSFHRAKLFPPVRDTTGHAIRYHQPAGTAPRLYLPLRARAALADPTVALWITEGEKKALKADQEGLACLALGGLWAWRHDGRSLADLDGIDWCERETVLVPDSDVWTRPDLLQPVYALGKELEGRGARVAVAKLPAPVATPGSTGAATGTPAIKLGLDDFLVAHPVAALAALPQLTLTHRTFARTATWWRGWKGRAATASGGSDDTAGDRSADGPPETALDLLQRGQPVRLLHPAQDVVDGVLWYGVLAGGQLVLVTSARQAHRTDQLPPGLALRHADPGRSTVSRDVAIRWLTTGTTGSMAAAFDGLAAFLARYVYFRDPATPGWLAAWVLGTWCYRAFRIFPYLSIRSAEKRCGKSRLLGLLARLAFNASAPTTHPTETQLYRGAARTGGVQLFDEVELLRGDRDRFSDLIAVLNAGFERGGVVTRFERRGERWVDVAHEVYAPRVLAGIAGLKDTLEDRALALYMVRKRRDEPVARLHAGVDTEAHDLRDACALACLTGIGNILVACDTAPRLLERQGIDDRAVDLWLPLVAVSLVADQDDRAGRTAKILRAAREQGGQREAEAEGGGTIRLLDDLAAIRAERGETLTPAELLAALQGRQGWDWVRSPRRLAGLLNPLGLARRQLREGEHRRWRYVLEAEHLADLRGRYGGEEPGHESDAPAKPPAWRTSGSVAAPVRDAVTPEPLERSGDAVTSPVDGGVSPRSAPVRWLDVERGDHPHQSPDVTTSPDW